MSTISLILRVAGYFALVPFCANICRASYDHSIAAGGIDFLLAAVTFGLILAYGSNPTDMKPITRSPIFWLVNALFYSVFPAYVIWLNWDSARFMITGSISGIYRVFLPDFQKYQALGAIGDLVIIVVMVWMPAAAILSTIAFALAYAKAPGVPLASAQ